MIPQTTLLPQGKLLEFHQTLFDKQAFLNDHTIQSMARQLALDMPKFNQDLHSQDMKAMVDHDISVGHQLGIKATPTGFINSGYLEGISLGDISEMIAVTLP